MNFGFTEEQEILRAEVRKFFQERCATDEVRRISETDEGYDIGLWKQMAELGWLGLLVPEQHGGVGLAWIDLIVLLEESGRALHPSPLLGSSLAALALGESASEDQQARWLPGLADGTSIFTIALLEQGDGLAPEDVTLRAERAGEGFVLRGEKLFVTDATTATHFVVSCRFGEGASEVGLVVVEAADAGLTVSAQPCIDATKRLGKLVFDDVAIPGDRRLEGCKDGAHAIARVVDQAAAAITAEAVGAAEAAHALTVEYAKNRVQFGSLIGRFQGVKHPLAESYVDIESFKSLLYYAAWCLDEAPGEAPRYVSMAKAYASDTFSRIGFDSVELHGALGYTWEYDAQLYYKRSKWAKAMYGSADHHYDRVAQLGGL